MTNDPLSLSSKPTLLDVLNAIEAAPNLTKLRRRDMSSAVRAVARALGRPPELIDAAPAALARRLALIAPVSLGITRGRWNNITSLLRQALALTRPMTPGRHREALNCRWQGLADRLNHTRVARLSRLMHWLSNRGIEPSTVALDHLNTFAAELRETSLSKNPERLWHDLVWAWNSARATVDGWPDIALPVETRRKTYSLNWSAFPASLKADVERYRRIRGGQDAFEELPCRPARRETLDMREWQIKALASALAHRGRAPSSLRTISDLVEIEAFKEGLRYLYERNGKRSSVAIHNLAVAVIAIAHRYVGIEGEALDRMKSVAKRLVVPHTGMTRKNRDRLRALNDPAVVEQLARLPMLLMKKADAGEGGPVRAALLAQTAVAVEILLMAPIRLKNLLSVEFDANLIESRGTFHLTFEPHEMKNSQEFDVPLPAESADLIRHYRDRHLPILAGSNQSLLFPGRLGLPKARSGFRRQLMNTIFRYTGLTLNPHSFRHARGKIHLDRRPGEIGIVSTALGHRGIGTTQRHYLGLERAAAIRHFDDVLLQLR